MEVYHNLSHHRGKKTSKLRLSQVILTTAVERKVTISTVIAPGPQRSRVTITSCSLHFTWAKKQGARYGRPALVSMGFNLLS